MWPSHTNVLCVLSDFVFLFIEDAMRRVTARPRDLELGDLCTILANCAWRFMLSVLFIDLVRSCQISADLVKSLFDFCPAFEKMSGSLFKKGPEKHETII